MTQHLKYGQHIMTCVQRLQYGRRGEASLTTGEKPNKRYLSLTTKVNINSHKPR